MKNLGHIKIQFSVIHQNGTIFFNFWSKSLSIRLKTVRMWPLKLHEQVLIWFRVSPPVNTTSRFKILVYILVAVVNVLVMRGTVLDTIFFIIRFISTDLQNPMHALFQLFVPVTFHNTFLYSCFVIFVPRTDIEIQVLGSMFSPNIDPKSWISMCDKFLNHIFSK